MPDEYIKTWELISNDETVGLKTWRLNVPGGWLVTVLDTSHCITNLTFIPDAIHNWTMEA